MSYYRTCPHCGAHLGPGESCDCLRQELVGEIMSMTEDECSSVLKLWHDEKTPAGAANTDEGKAEKVLKSSDSASTITENGGFVK